MDLVSDENKFKHFSPITITRTGNNAILMNLRFNISDQKYIYDI